MLDSQVPPQAQPFNAAIHGVMLTDGWQNYMSNRKAKELAIAIAQGMRDANMTTWHKIGDVIAMAWKLEAFREFTLDELRNNVGKLITDNKTMFLRKEGGTLAGFVKLTVMSGGDDEINHKLEERRAAQVAKLLA